MNYHKIYDDLINRSFNRIIPKEQYKEKHHIVPKCMGGSDDKSNIAILTPEEHYLAHQLLVKIYPNEGKIIYAARCMAVLCNDERRSNNKLFGWLREKYSKETSNRMKHRKISKETLDKMRLAQRKRDVNGDKNHFYGKTHTPEVKEKIRQSRLGKSGHINQINAAKEYMSGIVHTEKCRKLISEKLKSNPKVTCPHCGKVGAKSPMVRHHFDNCKMRKL
ncbi:hypothetical protein HPMBJEAJ_00199 [Aeromonas phage avDM6]|nr:hypothetical protein HPMBJEAJ_00199 [Aeromonas phage avDM6]